MMVYFAPFYKGAAAFCAAGKFLQQCNFTKYQETKSMKKRILIISGEASGDQHGAALANAVHAKDPEIKFLGMGGEAMRKAGVDIRVDAAPLAVVGVIEILQHIMPIYKAWRTLKNVIHNERPDLVLLIDYPAFNLQIAKIAKKAGIPVLYYISPKIWAWRLRRIKKIGSRIDKMLVIFPFEEALYREKGIPVEYVGHPLAERVQPDKDIVTMRREYEIDEKSRIVGLLPGSRKGEIQRLLPTMLLAAKQLKRRYPDLIFVLPQASSLKQDDLLPYLEKSAVSVKVIPEQFYNTVQLCSATIVASGTATLETALLQIPMVIIYKTAASTYVIARRVIQIPHIGLCNIVAGEIVAKELIQHEATPEAITAEVVHILEDEVYRKTMQKKFCEVKEKLGEGGGVVKAAEAVCKMLTP